MTNHCRFSCDVWWEITETCDEDAEKISRMTRRTTLETYPFSAYWCFLFSPLWPSNVIQPQEFAAGEGYHVGAINNCANWKTGRLEGNTENCDGGGSVTGRIRFGRDRSIGLLFVTSEYKVWLSVPMGSEDVLFMLYESCKFRDNRRSYQSAENWTQILGETETFPTKVTLSDGSIRVARDNVHTTNHPGLQQTPYIPRW